MPKAKFDKKRDSQNRALLQNAADQQTFIKNFNEKVYSFVGELHELKIPDFGASLYGGDSHSCVFHNSDTIVAATIADRITNKFERPDFNITDTLKSECNESWVKFEQELRDTSLATLSLESRGDLYRGRDIIRDILGPPKAFLSLVLRQQIDLGPGEQFLSKQGDVSLFTKLNDINSWTVTRDCAPMAALIIASNRGFRTILNEKFFKPSKYKKGYKKPVVTLDNFQGYPREVAYFAERVLSEFFYSKYGELHLLQHGARGTSVYKNAKARRFINIECLWNVIVQQMYGKAIRSRLKTSGNDLQHGQSLHKLLISSNDWSTCDWKNASDSSRTDRLRVLLHPMIFNGLDDARSHFVMITHQEDGQYFKAYHPIEKFSSMGNGFTFELLTLAILAMARIHDDKASVYGDDLICSSKVAHKVVKSVVSAGFTLNMKKTFIQTPLKESCGAFHLQSYGYITCYDVKWCSTIADCFVTINKFGRIIADNPKWNHRLKDKISMLYGNLLAMVNPCFMGPRNRILDLPPWVECENARTRQMRSSSCKRFHKERVLVGKISDMWHTDADWCVTLVPELPKFIKLEAVRNSDVKSTALIYTYLKDCRVSDMMLRNHSPVKQVKFVKVLISADGNSIRAATARSIIRDFVTNVIETDVNNENRGPKIHDVI